MERTASRVVAHLAEASEIGPVAGKPVLSHRAGDAGSQRRAGARYRTGPRLTQLPPADHVRSSETPVVCQPSPSFPNGAGLTPTKLRSLDQSMAGREAIHRDNLRAQ